MYLPQSQVTDSLPALRRATGVESTVALRAE